MLSDRRGAITAVFAVVFLMLMLIAAATVDYARIASTRGKVDQALDTAVLAAAEAVRADPSAQANEAKAKAIATAAINDFFAENAKNLPAGTVKVTATVSGIDMKIDADYAASLDMIMMGAFGIPTLPFTSVASAVASGYPYIDVTLLVDTSGSMALGATQGDIDKLSARFGCAFACHDNPGKDSYAWAEANNVKLRYDLIHDAVLNFADYVDELSTGGRIRVQLYSFDNTLRKTSHLSTDMDKLRKNLPGTPVMSSETAGATRFWEYAATIPTLIPNSGDGSKRSKAKQVVMMLTDGVQDPNRTWTWDVPLRNYVREMDPAFCTTVRNKGAQMAVVQVPYLRMTWDWGYNETLNLASMLGNPGKKRIDDVATTMQACGQDLYLEADTVEEVTSSFKTLFQRAVPIRLVR